MLLMKLPMRTMTTQQLPYSVITTHTSVTRLCRDMVMVIIACCCYLPSNCTCGFFCNHHVGRTTLKEQRVVLNFIFRIIRIRLVEKIIFVSTCQLKSPGQGNIYPVIPFISFKRDNFMLLINVILEVSHFIQNYYPISISDSSYFGPS